MSFIKNKVLTRSNRKILWTLLLLLMCLYVYFGHNYRLIYTYGISMEPTFRDGEMLLATKIKQNYKPKRFDVVVIRDVYESDSYTKRILGLPNEYLRFVNGKIYIDDKPLADPYNTGEWHHEEMAWKIPSNCIWVIGDNRSESIYGVFLLKEVEGLVR